MSPSSLQIRPSVADLGCLVGRSFCSKFSKDGVSRRLRATRAGDLACHPLQPRPYLLAGSDVENRAADAARSKIVSVQQFTEAKFLHAAGVEVLLGNLRKSNQWDSKTQGFHDGVHAGVRDERAGVPQYRLRETVLQEERDPVPVRGIEYK